MNELVILAWAVLFGCSLYGFFRGFVKTAFTFLIKLLSLIVGVMLVPYITSFLFRDVVSGNGRLTSHVLVFVIVYLFIMLGVRISVNALNILSRLPGLKSMNRICGLFAGFVEGIFVLWVLLAILSAVPATISGGWAEEKITESRMLVTLNENNLVSHLFEDVFLK